MKYHPGWAKVWSVMVPLSVFLCSGVFSTWWTISRADSQMRAELVQQARLVAKGIDVEHFRALTGSEADLDNPDYLRLKEELAAVRAAHPDFRFLYLMGCKPNGTLFFFVDSEQAGSREFSLPGMVYTEAPVGLRRVFRSEVASAQGPFTNRWGVWVSALVPVTDPRTGMVVAALGVDLNASTWRWNVLSRAALPLGFLLLLLIGLTAVFLAARRVGSSATPVLRRLLPSLAAGMVLMMAVSAVLLWQQQRYQFTQKAAADTSEISANLRTSLNQQTASLTAAAQSIAADPKVQETLREGAAGSLLATWSPPFEILRGENSLANFLFLDATRVCLLRVHKPESRGDRIGHSTALEAERTGKTVSSFDLAKSGTLTLRVVQPVFEGDKRVGYVELSKEIEDVLKKLHARSDIELAVIIRKEHLERELWEKGMRELGRDANWDRMPRSAVIYASQGRLPNVFLPWADLLSDGQPHKETNGELTFAGKDWRVSSTPLPDAAGKSLGYLLILRDVSIEEAEFARMVILFGTARVVLLGFLLGFIYVLLRRADRGIRAHQAALRESEQSYRDQFAKNSTVMLLIDPADGAIIDVNASAVRFYGYSRERLLELRITDLSILPTSDVHQAMASVSPSEGKRFQSLHRRADGSVRDVEVSASRVQFGGRAVIHSIIQDSTERRCAERELESSRTELKAVYDYAPVMMCVMDVNRHVLYANEAFKSFVEVSEDGLIDMPTGGALGCVSALDDPRGCGFGAGCRSCALRLAIADTFETGTGFHNIEHHTTLVRAGARREVVLQGSTVLLRTTDEDRLLLCLHDITERKRAEDLIERRITALTQPVDGGAIAFEDLFNLEEIQRIQNEFALATGVASIITHPDGTPITEPSNFTHLCSGIVRKTKVGCANCFKSDAVIGRYHPDGPIVQPCLSGGLWDAGASIVVGDRHIANWLIGQVRDEAQTEEKMRAYAREIGVDEVSFVEAFYDVPAMSRLRFEQIAQALFTLSTQLSTSAYQNVQQARFITERKKVEDALRVSEERYRELVENANSIIVRLDNCGNVTFFNEFAQRFFGYTEKEILGRNAVGTIVPESDSAARDVRAMISQIGIHPERFDLNEYGSTLRDGNTAWISWTHKPLLDATGQVREILCVGIDATARKRAEADKAKLESQLQQAQKMESVGRLAGGVAHDFNNMLGVILGHAELALDQLDPSEPLHADLTEVRKAAERSANLTRQLLAFARKQTVSPKVLDLNEAVAGMLKMLQRLIGEDIDLLWLPGADLGSVKIDPSQIDQILANLCVNARDAIVDVGKITIETENSSFDTEYCATHAGFHPGEFVRLSVSDDGCGMDKETLSHLFEPFFTTKEVGKGTGLGLATVYGAIKQNNGFINTYSEPGQGTTFTIYLPRHVGRTVPQHSKGRVQAVGQGLVTVLLVEDEPAILNMCKTMLENLGYGVVPAMAPGEAIRIAETHPGEIHLLMTDVVMPEMNGRDLAKNLLSLYPQLKRLFMSGYTADVIAHHGVLDEGVHFIQKPFSISDLASKVQEALSRE